MTVSDAGKDVSSLELLFVTAFHIRGEAHVTRRVNFTKNIAVISREHPTSYFRSGSEEHATTPSVSLKKCYANLARFL